MIPPYQFNFGNQNDISTNKQVSIEDYRRTLEGELERIKNNNSNNNSPVEGVPNIWDEINIELSSLNDEEKNLLCEDETYMQLDIELNNLIQEELVNSVRNKIINSEKGKQILIAHRDNIKNKKNKIKEENKKELDLFKQFQIATQTNPNLTYLEFIKTIKD